MAVPVQETPGAGNITITSGAQLALVQPATVNAGDVLLAVLFFGGSTTAPTPPSPYSTGLVSGPHSLPTPGTNGRVWLYGIVAGGSEDGVSTNWGNPAVTTPRRGRIYRFSGVRNDTIANIIGGISLGTGTTAPTTDTGVTTPEANCLACNMICQSDDTPVPAAFTGESGGTWVNTRDTAYTSSTGTPDTYMHLRSADMAAAGTINGGSATGSIDPWANIGFYVRGVIPQATPSLLPPRGRKRRSGIVVPRGLSIR